ncbi:MAG: glycoside hydrolase family 13 protein [Bacteroidota bacterium]
MKLLATFFTLIFCLSASVNAQYPNPIERVEPPFWWIEMPVQELQIQLYGTNIGSYKASLNVPGVHISRQLAVDSPNYLFLYLDIDASVQPQSVPITLQKGRETITLNYELKKRESDEGKHQGFDASDLIYLMMPDRFANGNPDNDSVEGMLETADVSDPRRRQGGDLQGVMDHLDYIKEQGMTAIWLMPIFENDMTPEYGGYHGYAATDMYRVDRRFGSNNEYKALIDAAHAEDMKVIMDMIHNHIGDQHWWMKDLPTADWVHSWEQYGQTSYRGPVASDPYASEFDKNKLEKGWFVKEMPDLNQSNPLLADYLIQNTIWWIEFSGIDGIRMDTYVFPNQEYMARWADEVLTAYPNFNIVGEAWLNFPGPESYWQYDLGNKNDGYQSHLPSITDFPLAQTIDRALNENFGWDNGMAQIWNLLGNDFLYDDPMLNVIFMDNHDMDRIFERLGKDEHKFKMAYAFLMTTRGIPQVYYGTELMMGHEFRGGDDEYRRPNMPGGWASDERSVFTEEGRTGKENEIFEYTKTLNHWRKNSPAIHEGKLVHFVPQNNVYVYFRVHEEQTVMVVINAHEDAQTVPRSILGEILDGFSSGKDVINKTTVDLTKDIEVAGKTALVLDLK